MASIVLTICFHLLRSLAMSSSFIIPIAVMSCVTSCNKLFLDFPFCFFGSSSPCSTFVTIGCGITSFGWNYYNFFDSLYRYYCASFSSEPNMTILFLSVNYTPITIYFVLFSLLIPSPNVLATFSKVSRMFQIRTLLW